MVIEFVRRKEEKEEIDEKTIKEQLKTFENLDKFLNLNIRKDIDEINSTLKRYESDIIDYQKRIIRYLIRKDHLIRLTEKSVNLENLEELLNNKHVQCAYIENNVTRIDYKNMDYLTLTVITKPIKIWKWDLGQYVIEYNSLNEMPQIKKVADFPHKKVISILAPYPESEIVNAVQYQHMHIFNNGACFGNAVNLIHTFWDNYNKGFNYCVQYLKCYRRSGAFIKLPYFLGMLGYLEDAEILIRKSMPIKEIRNDKFYDSGDNLIPIKTLKEWGLTGKKTPKYKIEEKIKESRFMKAKYSIEKNIRYIPNMDKKLYYHYTMEFSTCCDNCEIGLKYTEIKNVNVRGGIQRLCVECFNEMTEKCNFCKEYWFKEDIKYRENLKETMCYNCYNHVLLDCDVCGEKYIKKYMFKLGDEYLCEECYNEKNRPVIEVKEL